ncbi:MAG TPA: two-component regulator propeller domain-containing protein [Chryseolinea sp.]|nr:two-component regulator propeller domain-containing protein [Chryseolinea sp.]HPM30176.1 two-component regulator propeller domain-containing protein [Chryseolinea sp.]
MFLLLNQRLSWAQYDVVNFKHFSYRDGLVQSPIAAFLQDDQGFIWFGNLKGLTRYDGYEFKTFNHVPGDNSSISNDRVNTVFIDSEKSIWIATAHGLNHFNRDLETFESIEILEVKGGRNYISCIGEDQQKNIWVGTFAGLKKLNKATKKLEDVLIDSHVGLKEEAIFSLLIDRDNKMWVGSKSGLHKVDPASGNVIPLEDSFEQSTLMNTSKIVVIRQDLSGDVWFGTETSGLFRYSQAGHNLKAYVFTESQSNSISSNWIKDILVYDKNTIWVATQNGVSQLNIATNVFTNYYHDARNINSLSDNAVRCLMKDRASCIWVGTFSGGIDFYYKGNSNFINVGESVGGSNGLLHPLVNAITEDADGSLWVGTYGGGLTSINREHNSSTHYSVKSQQAGRIINGIKSMADDGHGNLWIGALEGLSVFNKKSKSFSHYNIPIREGKLSEKIINALLPDDGGAWIGSNGGGLKFFKNGKTISTYLNNEHALADNFVTALLKDTQDHLWVGTQNGLNYFNTTTQSFMKLYRRGRDVQYQISHNHVTYFFKDSKARLWVGTEDGLNYFDVSTERFYTITSVLGLADTFIHAITEDKDQNIWFSTDQGIIKVKFKKFEVPFNVNDLEVTNYSARDGLASNQFSNTCGLILQTGELAFGGINGLSIFSPDKISVNTNESTVALTEILINNKRVPISAESAIHQSPTRVDKIVLNHDQRLVTFKFAALSYINPEKNQYAYQIAGLSNSNEWQEIGNQRLVNFTSLLPGSYTFNIKASNDNGVWSSYIRSIKLIILPPWWKTWWAYTIYTILLVGLIFAISRLREYRRRMQADLDLEHLQNEQQQEIYNMKLNFFTNISHEIRTPLTLILGPVEKLIDSSANEKYASRQLHLIKNNASRLMKLVTELMDFRKAEDGQMKIHCSAQDVVSFSRKIFEYFDGLAVEKNITYEFVSDEESILLYFDANQLEKVIFNLLSNAFKFTPDNGKIVLQIGNRKGSGEWVDIHVKDNGRGIPESYHAQMFKNFFQVDDSGRQNIGSGVGLAFSKSIVDLHKGSLHFTSKTSAIDEPGCTTFTISLRKGKEHLQENQIENEPTYSLEHLETVESIQFENTDIEKSSGQEKKNFTIVIAEDNDDVRSFLVDTLIQNYAIIEFANGLDALQSMEHDIPDLIVSDIMMPGMDGLTLCTNVKSKESTNHIPVILLTARASESHQVEGLSTGADAYISKPFNTKILELTIKNLLTAKEIMREKFSQQMVLQPSFNIPLDSPEEKFIAKLMTIIESKMEHPEFDVNELVVEIGMSRSVLYKKVQTLTNYSVADLIKDMRLKKAAELFRQTSMTIADVAFAVGFNDRKYFSKEFKKQFNLSPSEFINTLNRPS